MRKGEEVKQQLNNIRTAYNHVWQIMETVECPICHSHQWVINDGAKYLMHYNLDESDKLNSREYSGLCYLDVYCRKCGYAMLFNVNAAAESASVFTPEIVGQKQINDENYRPSMTQYEERKLKKELQDEKEFIAKEEKISEIDGKITDLLTDDSPMTDEKRAKIEALKEEKKKYQ